MKSKFQCFMLFMLFAGFFTACDIEAPNFDVDPLSSKKAKSITVGTSDLSKSDVSATKESSFPGKAGSCDKSWKRLTLKATTLTYGSQTNSCTVLGIHSQIWQQQWDFSNLRASYLEKLQDSTHFCVQLPVRERISVLDNHTQSNISFHYRYPNSLHVGNDTKAHLTSQMVKGSASKDLTYSHKYTTSNLIGSPYSMSFTINGLTHIYCNKNSNLGATIQAQAGSAGLLYIYYKK